ncbi:MAG: hypothetical protein PHD32_02675 [Eubacteriales bacterium]|nr:hypothetical protein [Eubacteriales bacterium]
MLGEQRRYPAIYEQVHIGVTGRENREIQGWMVHPGTGRTWTFGSMVALMELLEGLFDLLDYPQPTHRLRAFAQEGAVDGKEKNMMEKAKESGAAAEKPTFVVKVQYRQNATWQGSIQWLEANLTRNFRSTLELIRLMDEAVGESADRSSWD